MNDFSGYHPTWQGKDFKNSKEYQETLEEIANKKEGQVLLANGTTIKVAGRIMQLWQAFKGFFGFENQTDPKVVSYKLALFLQQGVLSQGDTQNFFSNQEIQDLVRQLQTSLQKDDAYKEVTQAIQGIVNAQFASKETTAILDLSIQNIKRLIPHAKEKKSWISFFQKQTAPIPENIAKIHYNEARILMRLGKLPEAATCLDKACAIISENSLKWKLELAQAYLLHAKTETDLSTTLNLSKEALDILRDDRIALLDNRQTLNEVYLLLCAKKLQHESYASAIEELKRLGNGQPMEADVLLKRYEEWLIQNPKLDSSPLQRGTFYLHLAHEFPENTSLLEAALREFQLDNKNLPVVIRPLIIQTHLELAKRYIAQSKTPNPQEDFLSKAVKQLSQTSLELKRCRIDDTETFNKFFREFDVQVMGLIESLKNPAESIQAFQGPFSRPYLVSDLFFMLTDFYVENSNRYLPLLPSFMKMLEHLETTDFLNALDLYEKLLKVSQNHFDKGNDENAVEIYKQFLKSYVNHKSPEPSLTAIYIKTLKKLLSHCATLLEKNQTKESKQYFKLFTRRGSLILVHAIPQELAWEIACLTLKPELAASHHEPSLWSFWALEKTPEGTQESIPNAVLPHATKLIEKGLSDYFLHSVKLYQILQRQHPDLANPDLGNRIFNQFMDKAAKQQFHSAFLTYKSAYSIATPDQKAMILDRLSELKQICLEKENSPTTGASFARTAPNFAGIATDIEDFLKEHRSDILRTPLHIKEPPITPREAKEKVEPGPQPKTASLLSVNELMVDPTIIRESISTDNQKLAELKKFLDEFADEDKKWTELGEKFAALKKSTPTLSKQEQYKDEWEALVAAMNLTKKKADLIHEKLASYSFELSKKAGKMLLEYKQKNQQLTENYAEFIETIVKKLEHELQNETRNLHHSLKQLWEVIDDGGKVTAAWGSGSFRQFLNRPMGQSQGDMNLARLKAFAEAPFDPKKLYPANYKITCFY